MRRIPNAINGSAEPHLQQYEVCKLCGTMISTAFSGVMEKHIQAHKKNNELRQSLLQEFGQKVYFNYFNFIVNFNVTFYKTVCRFCNL